MIFFKRSKCYFGPQIIWWVSFWFQNNILFHFDHQTFTLFCFGPQMWFCLISAIIYNLDNWDEPFLSHMWDNKLLKMKERKFFILYHKLKMKLWLIFLFKIEDFSFKEWTFFFLSLFNNSFIMTHMREKRSISIV